ncbi:MAG: RpiB/LacA/LacB family sugar-phosphate isomerase [Limisphaerales bacterium]
MCGSGVGACVVANKVTSARACLIHEAFSVDETLSPAGQAHRTCGRKNSDRANNPTGRRTILWQRVIRSTKENAMKRATDNHLRVCGYRRLAAHQRVGSALRKLDSRP